MGRRVDRRGGVQVTLRHLHRFTTRHGRRVVYLRVPGHKSVALPGEEGSPEFMAAYNDAIASLTPAERPERHRPFSFNALTQKYWQTPRFRAKAPRTQYVERQVIERFTITYGHRDVRTLHTRHLDAIFAKMADRPGAAMDLRKRLRNLMRFAIKLGWRTDDPIAATDTFKGGTHHTWTDDEIAQFQAHWERGTRQRTAFDLLLYTGQRSGDVRAMTWSDVAGGRVRVAAQEKTGAHVNAPMHPELSATLASYDRKGVVIVLTQFERPFTQAGFGNWMADTINRAGLPKRCVAHGLRKAAARRLAEAGCTVHQIAAITGHRTLKEIARYTERAERSALADDAMEKVLRAKPEQTLANLPRKPGKSDA
jgi:enterobacteria phage integrase